MLDACASARKLITAKVAKVNTASPGGWKAPTVVFACQFIVYPVALLRNGCQRDLLLLNLIRNDFSGESQVPRKAAATNNGDI